MHNNYHGCIGYTLLYALLNYIDTVNCYHVSIENVEHDMGALCIKFKLLHVTMGTCETNLVIRVNRFSLGWNGSTPQWG